MPGSAADGVRASYFRRDFAQWGFPPSKARLDEVTYMVYFGPTMDFTTGQMPGNLNDPDLTELRRLCRIKGCRIIGALGGNAPAFSMMANATLRATAVQSIAAWCRNSRLDGIDIDFEHPANSTDRANLSNFMTELRSALGPRAFLSAAVANLGSSLSISAGVTNASLDSLHVMSYDHGGEHATLAAANSDMDRFLSNGVLRSRLILGVPFYGVHTTTRDAKSYAGILSAYDANPAPSVNSLGGYYFNGRDLIRTKGKLGMQKGGGVFTWIMDHDVTDGRSLLTAMHEGAAQGLATLDGFEYPLFADPNVAYTRKGITLKPGLIRTDGTYGVEVKMNFDGAAWSDVRMTSPESPPMEFPTDAAVRFDYFVPSSGPSGALFYFYDSTGRRIRYVDYSSASAGWHSAWFPRSGFELLDGGFDFENITRWMLLFTGTNGGTAVSPYSKTIHLDNLAMFSPGTKRPVRLDLDANLDGVPDVCTFGGSVVWQDRFRHHVATPPSSVYQFNGGSWTWKDGAYGAGRRVLSGTLDFSEAAYATRLLASPQVPAFPVSADSVLHLELDIHEAMPAGTLIADVLDDTGAYRRLMDYGILRNSGLKHIDLRMSALSGTADLSRITGWRLFFEGHGATSAPHTGLVDIANIAWGGLPNGSKPGVYDQDGDADGLSDIAEDRNSNGIHDNGETRADSADTDNDGTPDGVETVLGTSATDPASSFKAGITVTSGGNTRLNWASKPGTRFDVLFSADLKTWIPMESDITADESTNTTREFPRTSSSGFYKVRLTDPSFP